MKTKLLFILLAFSTNALFAQMSSDSLNRYDAKNKKIGFWKVYLDDYLLETADSSEAYFYAYDYYINGRIIIWTSSAQYYKRKALNVVHDSPMPQKGNPSLLNGNFKFYYKDGLGLDETYSDGLPILVATCATASNGESVRTEILDYTKMYNNQFGSMLYERYTTDGELTLRRYDVPDEKGKMSMIKVDE